MSENVTYLPGVEPSAPGEGNPRVILMLEDLLTAARAGAVLSIAAAVVAPGEEGVEPTLQWTDIAEHQMALVGAVAMLSRAIVEE
jgi:hypothetical protein